ncbi:MAG TPA: MoxR family ATPase [Candidatus Lokiarchaeia archaeon]|nr:MoxR family ATPase [Candidatus Lokiarchaeia archaeon]
MTPETSSDGLVKEIQEEFHIIGRDKELRMMIIAHQAGKNILLEGEIGTGKTTLAHAIAMKFDKNFHRVEGTEDLYSTTLIGTWQPPILIQKGYVDDAFEFGELAKAMLEGGCLFINEINRAPESTQNLLLTALDEGVLDIPNLKRIDAKKGFFTIATRNPASHIGVSVLGEALKDRFVWIKLDYQSEVEEREIVMVHTSCDDEKMMSAAVKITRATRKSKDIRRGSSIRGAIDVVSMLMLLDHDEVWADQQLWIDVAIAALVTKIDVEEGIDKTPEEIIMLIVRSVLTKDFFL